MISVIIPLYNKEDFVEKALASVLSQTYQDFELLVVNDGSTDTSLQRVKDVADPRIKVISTNNKGTASARNTGINAATNQYVALLDADDWWAPTFLKEVVVAINAFPQEKIFVTGRIHVFQSKEVAYTNKWLPKNGATGLVNHFKVLGTNLPVIHSSSVVAAKNHIEAIGGFKAGMQHFEDHECWHRLAIDHAVVFINKPLSFYNKTVQGSMSTAKVRCNDLIHYYNTMLSVSEQLSGREKRCFRKFYQRFAKWSYLKFAPTYSKEERMLLQESLVQLVSKMEVKILDELQKMGIASIYQRAKNMRNGGA
ncbi:glycosyltransferase family 2 protein [Rasiella rasia]|uniref:Glycosyltransferase family 2 protein n=1 Tax=Rasiella rasia TaxID=2744027 RepID=A0A6G6GIC6_9FLAO|nr:glycosyltransferase family 2 protein [Rasiella rasia]QIE58260.1 glycosyltransferase family 2 protein [Rasiella rasia]